MTECERLDPVKRLVEGQRAASRFLRESGQISFAIDIERELAKMLILAAASYFEHRIIAAIEAMAAGPKDERIVTLVRKKAIKRQYHTYFDWDNKSLGSFRTMFGDGVADALKERAKDTEFRGAHDAFLDMGLQRNLIVHGNFATYSVDGSVDEWLAKYDRAERFVAFVESLLSPPGQPDA